MAYTLKVINKSNIYDVILEAGARRPYWFECFAEEFAYFLTGNPQWIENGPYKIKDPEERHDLYEIIFNLWRSHVKSGLVRSTRTAGNRSLDFIGVILRKYQEELQR